MTERTSNFVSTYDDDTAAVKSVAPIYNMTSNLRNDTFVVNIFWLSALLLYKCEYMEEKTRTGRFLVAL